MHIFFPQKITCHQGAPTCKFMVDEIDKVGVVPPPEEPKFPSALPLAAPPHAQHICLQAAAEAAEDGVLFRHWEDDGCRGGTLPHKPLPFDPCQVSLQDKEMEKEIISCAKLLLQDLFSTSRKHAELNVKNKNESVFCFFYKWGSSVIHISHKINAQVIKM